MDKNTKPSKALVKTAVSSSNVREGLKVIDIDGIIGTIKQCYDSHNIWVLYDNNGGSGFYCVEKSCDDYDPLYYC